MPDRFPFDASRPITEGRTFGKAFLAEMAMAALALNGQNKVVVSREQLEDEVWRDLVVDTHLNQTDRSLTVHFRFRSKNLQAIADANAIADAEYEIVEEPSKQLKSGG